MPKLPRNFLEDKFFNRSISDPTVVKGPEYGEDAAVIDLEDGYMVIHSDPISGAVENIGWLSVVIPANDVAVTGAEPRFILPCIEAPGSLPEEALTKIIDDLVSASTFYDINIIGGHTERVDDLKNSMIISTALGFTDEPIYTSGSSPGDHIIQHKEAGIEGTWILSSDFEEELKERGVTQRSIEECKGWREDISVIDEALAVREKATSLHDPTEGGVLQGLLEMAIASGNRFVIDSEIQVREETMDICDSLGISPLKLISSGCLLSTSSSEVTVREGSVIGEVKEGKPGLTFHGEEIGEITEDELFKVIDKFSS